MDFRKQLRRQAGLGAWTIAGGLYGTKRQVRAARHEVRRALAGPGRSIRFFDDAKLRLAERLLRPLAKFRWAADVRRKLLAVHAVLDMNRGIPSARFLAGSYWKHRGGLPGDLSNADPARDGCGFYWLPPVLPFSGEALREFLGLVEPIFDRWGFDFFVTLSTVTERALSAVMTIAYDKESEAETRSARACYEELLERLLAFGFPPYRAGPHYGPLVSEGDDGYWETVARLRSCLDADGIIAPGRYDPLR
jgi:4-cresol dehydrogenase (hydroxylating)